MPAPYSDNLYSTAADLSDDDADALSPTDGYFHASSQSQHDQPASSSHHFVPRRPNVFVEDPTVAGPSSAKAREADLEASAADYAKYPPLRQLHHNHPNNHNNNSQSQSSYISLPQPSSASHSNLFSHHRDAPPPAYTPSPTSSSTSPRTGYQTFGPSNSTMGLPEDQQRLIPRPPESMGNPLTPPSSSRWQQFKVFIADLELRKKLKTALGVLAVLFIIAMLMSTFTARPKDKGPQYSHGEPASKHPNMDHEKLTWKPTQGCRNTDLEYTNNTFTTAWSSDRSLKLVQETDNSDGPIRGRTPRVSGELVVRPTDDASAGRVEVEIITNDKELNVKVNVADDAQEIRVVTPRGVPYGTTSEGPCIQIKITAWAPQDATLRSLSIRTVHLDVLIEEGLGIALLHPLAINTVVGNVKTPLLRAEGKGKSAADIAPYKLDTREIRVGTVSGDVKGWFPLLDVLDIRTASGDVAIDASPKPADKERPRPAALRVNSQSGSLTVDEHLQDHDDLPARDYTVELSTKSGHITAKVAASSFAQVHSQSGDFDLEFLPVIGSTTLKDFQSSLIKTESTSGDSRVTILEPLWTGRSSSGDKPPVFGALTSKHTSISGDVSLKYPGSWEGSLSTSTISGSQDVRGDGLEIDKREDNPWSKKTEAHKGEGKSRMDVKTVSGDVDILIGHE
ncbi:hypothetical protein B0T10DRAFT_413523 [Thelonectria olida]|uniref:DUF4097 domain-containing protein n=1 Tax=Thelonectria olida TaxID=1576542 RepID=A0A9P8VXJ7_9HYPO|nr:hypothetical protein B0T10DRAFT_413523 [Thelonectria olida]